MTEVIAKTELLPLRWPCLRSWVTEIRTKRASTRKRSWMGSSISFANKVATDSWLAAHLATKKCTPRPRQPLLFANFMR